MESLTKPLDSTPALPSLTDELFGSKGSLPPSSTANISSIFPPPRTAVMGKSSDIPEPVESPERSQETAEELTKMKEEANSCERSKGRRSSILEKIEPCPLSSSLYYGGREDVFIRSSNVGSLDSFPEFKKDDNDRNGNDSHFASRGNWWEGSLYY